MPNIDYKLPYTESQLFNYQIIANENSDQTISLYLINHKNSIEPEITTKTIPRDQWENGIKDETKSFLNRTRENS